MLSSSHHIRGRYGYFFCEHCRKESAFWPIYAARIAGVSRSTMYYWMSHSWVHWRELPSGRRVICSMSLSRPISSPTLPLSAENSPSETVQYCSTAQVDKRR